MMPEIDIATLVTMAGVADVTSLTTLALLIIASTKKGREWLIKPAIQMSAENRARIKKVEIGLIRQDLLLLLHTHPGAEPAIEAAYDEYRRLMDTDAPESYIDRLIAVWREDRRK